MTDSAFTICLAVGAWALGEAVRSRRAAIHEEARRALGEEHARIARELHDVIAHSVSVIVVQASAADDVFDERPDQARQALRSIEEAGRDALGELRRLLGGFRPSDERDGVAPQPGLDRVDELAEPLRAGGLEVVVRREGERADLPAGLDLSAYRIVQEALTNTLRHGHATRAEVTLSYGPDALEVDVRDDGRTAPANGDAHGGHGLVGHARARGAAGRHPGGGPIRGGRLPRPRPAPARVLGVTVRVAIADDQALVRGGFRMILDNQEDIEVVGEASNGLEAVELVDRADRPMWC